MRASAWSTAGSPEQRVLKALERGVPQPDVKNRQRVEVVVDGVLTTVVYVVEQTGDGPVATIVTVWDEFSLRE